jgi:hypothetical protein
MRRADWIWAVALTAPIALMTLAARPTSLRMTAAQPRSELVGAMRSQTPGRTSV